MSSSSNYIVHTLLRARDWQHRPQFDRVCDWWRGGGPGVCALVGMGGAGKTAIAERFLNALPNVMPVGQASSLSSSVATSPDEATHIDPPLPQPHSVFVYSFYDDDKPENFFRNLQMWLEGTPRLETVLTVGPLMFLVQQRQGLIILDGLEKVQESGARGGFGRLISPSLRDLLNHIACGSAPELSVLVTSRFPLADLRDSQPRFFRPIAVDQIDVAAGVGLLRDRGVRGTDVQLAPVVEQCGRHALTVDLAGGYIKEYGGGNPATPLDLGTAEELQAEAEQEPDDDKRRVLKQGIRFARIAQRYREAMLTSDEAALALLERICLFRLGVDCETLAAIFTGPEAEKVSGKALAGLDGDQLQRKLDWLVRMRIVEASDSNPKRERGNRAGSDKDPSLTLRVTIDEPRTLYTIHPAVRDGFLGGISRDAAVASHEAVRQGLEVSLGDAPGKNPSDRTTLDLLEEIVHHTAQSGHVPEAWGIYWNRIGGYKNLGWRLGAYERGERICRAFAGCESPETVVWVERSEDPPSPAGRAHAAGGAASLGLDPPYQDLPESTRAIFINGWGLYLKNLGRLAAAARCHELNIEIRMRQENWKNASIGNQNLCDVWLLSGRLTGSGGTDWQSVLHAKGALASAAEALRLAELADDAEERWISHAYRAHARALRGEVPAALADFRATLDWQHKAETHAPDRPLWSLSGIWHTHLLGRLGRREEATRLTEANKEILAKVGGDYQIPQCNLVLSDLPGEALDRSSRESLCISARDWASQRGAKEVLCWSALVRARMELAKIRRVRETHQDRHTNENEDRHTNENEDRRTDDHEDGALHAPYHAAENTVAEGLKIARDCGYGIYHIDLLVERARLHLLRGDPGAALEDIRVALDTGIAANDETGQPELLGANHEQCGYAWAIPAGLELRAEALLLGAAQTLRQDSYVPAKIGELPADVGELIDQAKQHLHEALDRWHELRDPEPTEDNNFQLDGKEYNYRAAETWHVLDKLNQGVLTQYETTPDRMIPVAEKRFLKTFAAKVAKGGVKSLPIVGGVLEEAIFGVMDAEDARKEAAKLQFALMRLEQSVDAQDQSLKELLQLAKAQAKLSPQTERIIDAMSTEEGLSDMVEVIDRVVEKHDIDATTFEDNPDQLNDVLTEQLRPETVSRVKLLGKLAEVSHADLTMLVAALNAGDAVPTQPQNRKTRASQLVEWAYEYDMLPELIFAARSYDFKGFSRAIPDPQ